MAAVALSTPYNHLHIFNDPRMAPHAKSSRGPPKVLKQGKTQIRQQKRKREQEGVQQLEARVKELVRGGVKC